MTQGERVKELRKNLSLTLEKFGERLGVGKSTISDIENNRRCLTAHMTKSICREFNVDYIWLTTGQGEMFIDNDSDVMAVIDRVMTGGNESHKRLMKFVALLEPEEILHIEQLIDKYNALTKED